MVEKLWDYLTNSANQTFGKLALIIFGIAALLSVDYFFRFSDSYIAEKKIEQIGKIQEIIKQDSLRVESKNELIRIENQVIARQGFWDFLTSLIQSTTSSPKQKITAPIATKPIIKDHLSKTPQISLFWHIVSSSWPFILLIMIVPFTPFVPSGQDKITFTAVIAIEIVFILLSAFYSFILRFIPIFENTFWNYALNAISIPLLILLLSSFVAKKT